MILTPEQRKEIRERLFPLSKVIPFTAFDGVDNIQIATEQAVLSSLEKTDELEKKTDNEIYEYLGMIENGEPVEEIRDKFILTEAEQDKAIILFCEAISFRGAIEISDETKKYGAYDALCFKQFLKSFRALLPIISAVYALRQIKAVEQARKEGREKIINTLQELLELNEKVKEPAIKVKMMSILEALKGATDGK